MSAERKILYLCGGAQSSGSTLVSWCFLQRRDMDGVLDAAPDLLPSLDPGLGGPLAWYKTTLVCFRLCELADYHRDQGWEVHPLLVVRDVREVWASLVRKSYGSNGITAEDPPLRMRLRRFLDDWQRFRANDWPILQYEELVGHPRRTLAAACDRLGLPWDEAMLTWPKHSADIADCQLGNKTFWNTRASNLLDTLASYAKQPKITLIPAMDLGWLEDQFREFNAANGYPLHIELPASSAAASPPLSFATTRRYHWEIARRPIRRLLLMLGFQNRSLIERCSVKQRRA
jgi:hypothetical protein